MEKTTFLDYVQDEREYQKTKWGTTDHLNTEYNYGAYIAAYASRSLIGTPGDDKARRVAFKEDMIKVAALAMAAYEQL